MLIFSIIFFRPIDDGVKDCEKNAEIAYAAHLVFSDMGITSARIQNSYNNMKNIVWLAERYMLGRMCLKRIPNGNFFDHSVLFHIDVSDPTFK